MHEIEIYIWKTIGLKHFQMKLAFWNHCLFFLWFILTYMWIQCAFLFLKIFHTTDWLPYHQGLALWQVLPSLSISYNKISDLLEEIGNLEALTTLFGTNLFHKMFLNVKDCRIKSHNFYSYNSWKFEQPRIFEDYSLF